MLRSSLLLTLAGCLAAIATLNCSDDGLTSGGGGASSSSSGGGAGGDDGPCIKDTDCGDGKVCDQGSCLPPSCVDGVHGETETDVDCGGGECLGCANDQLCTQASDCISGFCQAASGVGGAAGMGGSQARAGGSCAACVSHADCAGSPGTFCDGGMCSEQKSLGANCADSAECGSGFCPAGDGICCNQSCSGSCEACSGDKTGGEDGSCAAVTADTDPDAECPDQGAASCGSNGSGCNGLAATPGCNLYSPATACAPPSCSLGSASAGSSCDGVGSCVAPAANDCSPYACNAAGTACTSSCNSHLDCGSGFYCAAGSCVAHKSNGDGCTEGAQCGSGFCPSQDGICCDSACSGGCQACLGSKTGGSNGVCGPVSGGTDPDAECSTLLAPNCNGSGSCG